MKLSNLKKKEEENQLLFTLNRLQLLKKKMYNKKFAFYFVFLALSGSFLCIFMSLPLSFPRKRQELSLKNFATKSFQRQLLRKPKGREKSFS
jgi:hypothetical protein